MGRLVGGRGADERHGTASLVRSCPRRPALGARPGVWRSVGPADDGHGTTFQYTNSSKPRHRPCGSIATGCSPTGRSTGRQREFKSHRPVPGREPREELNGRRVARASKDFPSRGEVAAGRMRAGRTLFLHARGGRANRVGRASCRSLGGIGSRALDCNAVLGSASVGPVRARSRAAGAHVECDGAGQRGVRQAHKTGGSRWLAVGGGGPRVATRRSGRVLRGGGAGHAAHPDRSCTRQEAAEARRRQERARERRPGGDRGLPVQDCFKPRSRDSWSAARALDPVNSRGDGG